MLGGLVLHVEKLQLEVIMLFSVTIVFLIYSGADTSISSSDSRDKTDVTSFNIDLIG